MTENSGVEEVLRVAAFYRARGDALRKKTPPAPQQDIDRAYRTGARRIEAFIADEGAALPPADLAELHGVLGGLLRRLNDLDGALDSYRKGAEQEDAGQLASTYNRLNTIRLALLIGRTTLAQLSGEIDTTASKLDGRLRQDVKAADDAWLWADLGDMQLLRGDEAAAYKAYRMFVAKAESGSPRTTLSVLQQISAALEERADPAAGSVRAAVERVSPLLGG